jgi:hypothetical protein
MTGRCVVASADRMHVNPLSAWNRGPELPLTLTSLRLEHLSTHQLPDSSSADRRPIAAHNAWLYLRSQRLADFVRRRQLRHRPVAAKDQLDIRCL